MQNSILEIFVTHDALLRMKINTNIADNMMYCLVTDNIINMLVNNNNHIYIFLDVNNHLLIE